LQLTSFLDGQNIHFFALHLARETSRISSLDRLLIFESNYTDVWIHVLFDGVI